MVEPIDDNKMTIKWTLPKGETPIKSSIFQMKEGGSSVWEEATYKVVSPEDSLDLVFQVTGLEEDSTYEFKVIAIDKVGQQYQSAVSTKCTTLSEFYIVITTMMLW